MSNPWASLSEVDHRSNFAWQYTDNLDPQPLHDQPNLWASVVDSDANASSASAWAALAGADDDDEAMDDVAPVAIVARVVTADSVRDAIAIISNSTTVCEIKATVDDICNLLAQASDNIEIGNCILHFEELLGKIGKCDNGNRRLEHYHDSENVSSFVVEQLASVGDKGRSIESQTVEASRHGFSRKVSCGKRSLMSVCTVTMQTVCANAFLTTICNRTEACGGVSETYFEKHRGDETPFASCSAEDTIDDTTLDTLITDAAPIIPEELAIPKTAVVPKPIDAELALRANTSNTNLKVYQTDLEIAGLYLLNGSELLVSFKLVRPLARVDRCTGEVYRWLHDRQSNVLPVRHRFNKNIRLHTSDGDKAQTKAERALSYGYLKNDDKYKTHTLRGQCQVHRVYHCITLGLALYASFISGQFRLALSLRGPGHFHKFKEVFFEFILHNHRYIRQENHQGPGQSADEHRANIWNIFFQTLRGKHQRKIC